MKIHFTNITLSPDIGQGQGYRRGAKGHLGHFAGTGRRMNENSEKLFY